LVIRYAKGEKGEKIFNKDGSRKKISTRVIGTENIVEILFNPSKRDNNW